MFSYRQTILMLFCTHALANGQMSTPETNSQLVVSRTNPELLFTKRPSVEMQNGSVYWTLKTIPAVFGKAVQLQCHLNPQNTRKNRTIQWSRGKDHRLLVMNGVSTNEKKYNETFDKASDSSFLTIKKFDMDDVNIEYICQHGFSTYRKTLKLMPSNFEYIPEKNRTFVRQKTGIAFISITFDRVYPVPVCTALYWRQNITDMVNIQSVLNGSIYTAEISLTYHQATTECFRHPIDLICLVGTKKINHRFDIQKDGCSIDKYNNGTSQQKEKDQTLGKIGQTFFTFVFAFYLAAFTAACYLGSNTTGSSF